MNAAGPPSVPATRTLHVADVEALDALARRVAAGLRAMDGPWPLLALDGPLGAGKTTFVARLARALGVPASLPVPSPTFTLERSYDLPGPGPRRLHHLDAWRLSGAAEWEALGLEACEEDDALACVEWASRVEEALPRDRLGVVLEPDGSGRLVHLVAGGPRAARLLALVAD